MVALVGVGLGRPSLKVSTYFLFWAGVCSWVLDWGWYFCVSDWVGVVLCQGLVLRLQSLYFCLNEIFGFTFTL
jgi:hypothetical protein